MFAAPSTCRALTMQAMPMTLHDRNTDSMYDMLLNSVACEGCMPRCCRKLRRWVELELERQPHRHEKVSQPAVRPSACGRQIRQQRLASHLREAAPSGLKGHVNLIRSSSVFVPARAPRS